MQIIFNSTKMEKTCNDSRKSQQRFGSIRAKILRRRLDELRAADTLENMRPIVSARCHELSQNRKGQLSVDLDHPYRLLFVPEHDPIPIKPDGGLDWGKVTAIRVLDVEDTHE